MVRWEYRMVMEKWEKLMPVLETAGAEGWSLSPPWTTAAQSSRF